VAQVNSLAASAAYWLASQADEIISIPSGTAGSIGVFTAHQDLSKALAQEGIDITLISAGKYKVEGNPFEPLTPEAKAVLQDRVDTAYAQFVKDVAQGRGVSQASVRDGYGQGRALGAKEALKAGLIDAIATMDQTLSRLTGRTVGSGMRAEGNPDALAASADDLRRLL
jgi:signal peptide peptidase SppA